MSRLLATSFALLWAASGLIFAQVTADPPRRPEGGRRQQPPEQRDTRNLDNLKAALKLDPDHAAKFDSILDDSRRARASLDEEMRAGRARLLQAVREGKSDVDLEKLNQAQGSTYAKISANEVWAMSRIYALLNDDQKKIAEAAFNRVESVTAQRPPGFPVQRQQ